MIRVVFNLSETKNYITSIPKTNDNYNFYIIMKRLFDVSAALFIFLILLPVFLLIMIIIKIDSKGNVFFIQKRTGKNGKIFNLYKFRSMKQNNDVTNLKKENEITRVGSFIRKTSLDELPQLINILKGDMSFIGPRPWIPEYYENMNIIQRQRTSVLPGLTGNAQVNGRNGISVFEKINYDLDYINNASISFDIKIFFETLTTILKKEDVDISKFGIKSEIDFLKEQNK